MPRNPITDFKNYKTEQSEKRKGRDIELWQRWKEAPAHEKPKHLEPLLEAYRPTFTTKVRQLKPPTIPESAFRADLQKHFIDALHNYDPSKAALSTHVEQRLMKSLRFVNKAQNFGYIPEGSSQHIGKIQRARDELMEDLGREPTHDELADHLGLTPAKVKTVLTSMRKDLPASFMEELGQQDEVASAREQEVLGLLPMSLSKDEKDVFDHIFGMNGKPKTTETGLIAQAIGKSPSQVSRLRKSIMDKYNKFK